jgi:hypothetical protein
MRKLSAQDAKQNMLHREYQAQIITLKAGIQCLHAELVELQKVPQAPAEDRMHRLSGNAACRASC